MSSETCYLIEIYQHDKKFLPTVVNFLNSREIKDKKIFTEAGNTETKSHDPFYGKLSKYLSDKNAVEIHEPDYEASMKQAITIYEETLPPALKAARDSSFGLPPWLRKAEFDRFMQIICQIRDPIIAKQIIDNTPMYSIFGPGHIPGVLALLREQSKINIEVVHLQSAE